MSELLLYESKGASKGRLDAFKMNAIVFLFLAALLLYGSYSIAIENPYYLPSDQEVLMMLFTILGVLALVMMVICIKWRSMCKGCWVKVYDGYIEARTLNSHFWTEPNVLDYVQINLELSKVDYVRIVKYDLFVTVGGKREKLICEDPERLYSLINGLIDCRQNNKAG